jgi:hypothetical protein
MSAISKSDGFVQHSKLAQFRTKYAIAGDLVSEPELRLDMTDFVLLAELPATPPEEKDRRNNEPRQRLQRKRAQ